MAGIIDGFDLSKILPQLGDEGGRPRIVRGKKGPHKPFIQRLATRVKGIKSQAWIRNLLRSIYALEATASADKVDEAVDAGQAEIDQVQDKLKRELANEVLKNIISMVRTTRLDHKIKSGVETQKAKIKNLEAQLADLQNQLEQKNKQY